MVSSHAPQLPVTHSEKLTHTPELYPAIPACAAASFVYDSPPPATPQPGLVRTTQMAGTVPATNPFVVRTKARLEIDGDLNTMKQNW